MSVECSAMICVLTFSYDRPRALARCIASVAEQVCNDGIRHVVLSERTAQLRANVALNAWKDAVEWVDLAGEPCIGPSSPRMARLRQDALTTVREPYVCFLDDDNEYLPEHLASLIELISASGLEAAHSWRVLLEPDGAPFDGLRYPWHHDPVIAKRLHAWCIQHGVIEPGSPVVRDMPIDDSNDSNVATVDMNEWLFRTDCIRRIGFETCFTPSEIADSVGEDDKLLARMLAASVRFGCSQRATVRYRLGGISNTAPSLERTVTPSVHKKEYCDG